MKEKKHYVMGDAQTSPEQQKEAGIARAEHIDSIKANLENTEEARLKEAEAIDIQKIIASFPWRAHQDRVVILPDPAEYKLPSGIIIPDTATEKPQSGVIIALGEEMSVNTKIMEHLVAIRSELDPEFKDDGEKPYLVNSKLGDRVLFGRYAGMEIEIDKVKYLVMRYGDVMATLS